MAAKTKSYSNNLLKYIFNGDAYSSISNNLYVSLHTAVPNVFGDQASHEAEYVGYERVAIPRNSTGWVVYEGSVYPADDIIFPACTGDFSKVTHFGIGIDATGSGELLYFGSISPSIDVTVGVTPILSGGVAATLITET